MVGKVYIVGGFQGRAFTSEVAAMKFASVKSSIVEMPLYGEDTEVEISKGSMVFINPHSCDFKIQPYTFNNIDNPPGYYITRGYGQFRIKVITPLSTKDVKEHVPNITTYLSSVIGDKPVYEIIYKPNLGETLVKNIQLIVEGGENDLAKAVLSTQIK